MIKINLLILLFFFFYIENTYGQIKWTTISDTITLTPSYFQDTGIIYLNYKKKDGSNRVGVSGIITVSFLDNRVYLNDWKNVYLLNNTDILQMGFTNYGEYLNENLFTKNFHDSLLLTFRRTIYHLIGLNEVSFSVSKKVKYDFDENGLFIRNQKKIKGKVCYCDINQVVLLTEEGELLNFRDGDFNFLEYNGLRGFKCESFYSYLFVDYTKQLTEIRNQWRSNVFKTNIKDLIDVYGPIDNSFELDAISKLFVWKNEKVNYYLDIFTSSKTEANIFGYSNSNLSASSNNYLAAVSPFFIYGNKYLNATINQSLSTSNVTINSTSQKGNIISQNESEILSVVVDKSGRITNIYEKKIFSNPSYGQSFKFINF
jgi:hypothetical protein